VQISCGWLPEELASTYQHKMSVWAPHNSLPLIIIGQDESVFSQFLLTSKMWMGPHQEVPLLPRSEGDGQTISAMQSRDLGFGLQIHDDQLAQINEWPKKQNYLNTTAATEIFSCVKKKPLVESPFIWSITIGVNHDGYLTHFTWQSSWKIVLIV